MDHFIINASGTYTREEIPPRCRKPRPVTHETSAQAQIPSVTSDESPVAFRIRDLDDRTTEVRTHDGRLFAPYRTGPDRTEPILPGSTKFPQDVDTTFNGLGYVGYPVDSEDAYRQAVQDQYRKFLIIDGIVWVEAGEPSYSVSTFGMGGNHGGTGLMVNRDAMGRHSGATFRADEFEDAHAYAIEVANRRGDTRDVARYQDNPEHYRCIEVVIPEAVTLVTVAPSPQRVRRLRTDYSMAIHKLDRASTPDEETEAFARVVVLREEIVSLGYTPIESNALPYEARHGADETP